MSVNVIDREESSMQFIATARELLKATLSYCSLLSNRRWRTIGDRAVLLAQDVLQQVGCANGIYPTTPESTQLRLQHLYEAQGALSSLSLFITICCDSIYENPQGAFVSATTNKPFDKDKCIEKVNRMSANIGKLLNTESSLLQGQINKYKKE